ncbi:MAG: FAD/FMN-dependent dehydrogenase [Desertimonas sp.]|nr:FAD/FMN-dependent dehydrogenase [Desertimonas sp.]
MSAPTPPIELTGTEGRWPAGASVSDSVLRELAELAPLATDEQTTAEASRDWWPLALHWSLAGAVPCRAAAVSRPATTQQVAAVAALCHRERIPLTVSAGRSGVSGGAVPAFGGVLLDVTGLRGVGDIDETSGVVEVAAGTFGPELEDELARHDLSVGHFPQSFDLATVGGWIACRGAGQYSTRYGKIEDLVVGLEVVLADGRVVRTGGAPAAATGPDLNALFVGSEGTLGIITRAWLRAHPRPVAEHRAAYHFASFADGVEACRRILRSGATPAVLRLYDEFESLGGGRGGDGTTCTLIVLDEGQRELVDATMAIVARCVDGATEAGSEVVDAWLVHRNDTSALQSLTRQGYVVDTMEVAAPWSRLVGLSEQVCAALGGVPHSRSASCHLSHSYSDGACVYFTFLAQPPAGEIESTYVAMWDAGQRAALAGGGNLSHHHGVGINRSRFMGEALGEGLSVLAAIKQAIDPHGVLNPGKLGLPSPFGDEPWPRASAATVS